MIEIVIWVSPADLDDLEKTLTRLNLGKDYLSEEDKSLIKFNVKMCISDEIINWKETLITKEECVERFLNLKKLCEWSPNLDFITTTTICGCTSMRNESSKSDSEYYIWLDTDIVYDPILLPYMLQSAKLIKQQGYDKFVITPELVRQWDATWDCLVNDKFITETIGYQAINNPYVDTTISEDINTELVEVRNNITGQPYMKFAGGWFTLISKELLNLTPFPENYGHYGLDDTFIMWVCHFLNDNSIKQFKIKNIVVCENYFDRIFSYKDKLKFIDRRGEYKKYNEELFVKELKKYEKHIPTNT